MTWEGIEVAKETIEIFAPSFFSLKKWIKLIPKLLEIEKEIVREVALERLTLPEKICRSKNTSQEGIRSAHRTSTDSCFRSADFRRLCSSPERNLTHNLFFYFE